VPFFAESLSRDQGPNIVWWTDMAEGPRTGLGGAPPPGLSEPTVSDINPVAEAELNKMPELASTKGLRVGNLYGVVGVIDRPTGPELRIYGGSAKSARTRLQQADHPMRPFLKDVRTSIFGWDVSAVLDTKTTESLGYKMPEVAARKQALGVPEQPFIDDITEMQKAVNKGIEPPPAKTRIGELLRKYVIVRWTELPSGQKLAIAKENDIPALRPENVKEYALRHKVTTPDEAYIVKTEGEEFVSRVTLARFANFMSAITVILGAYEFSREMNLSSHGLVESQIALPCEDDYGTFFFIIYRGWFKTTYYKYYVNGAWRGRRVASVKEELDRYNEEYYALFGNGDAWGNFVPGLLAPDPLPFVRRAMA
jgi:hypothetical protein